MDTNDSVRYLSFNVFSSVIFVEFIFLITITINEAIEFSHTLNVKFKIYNMTIQSIVQCFDSFCKINILFKEKERERKIERE